ncbi:MAG TPA: ribonuclease HII [Acidobacteriota bacterium]|nr:ribonuclease HII [Acidobacteriota bacterium]
MKKLRELFPVSQSPLPDRILDALEKDGRSGARRLACALRTASLKKTRETERLEKMLRFEKELYAQGIRLIAGIDEAGMAPLAGPVIAAAVILPKNYMLPGLNDSKKIHDSGKREALAAQLKRDAVAWSTGRVDGDEIDRLNIYQAGLFAMKLAMDGLAAIPEYLLVDARNIPFCAIPQRAIIRGDEHSASIAAASIIAKTTRDAIMIQLDGIYPGFGLAVHKGYPTPAHLALLKRRGPLPIHRRSFAPVRDALESAQKSLFSKNICELK